MTETTGASSVEEGDLTVLPLPTSTTESQASAESTIDRASAQVEELLKLAEEAIGEFDDNDFPVVGIDAPVGFLLSVVIPVYNEKDSVRTIVGKVLALPVPVEIIVVDDGSTDGTQEILRELSAISNVHVLLKRQNEGKGAALRSGFSMAQGDVVIVQDADLEYDPRDIPSLVQPIIDGYADVVYGSRFLERQYRGSSFAHRLGNRLLTLASNLTNGLHLTDMETCYKVIRRDALDQIPLCQNRFGIEPELTAKIARRDLRVIELPIHYNARDWNDGKKIGIKDAFAALYCILRYAISD
ncbi:MAG: glycosyltransferase family 2 protein [Planctomycetales bacterium]|nr:glycosyltransferase family 2 protein [Planctomycetales bacterium]